MNRLLPLSALLLLAACQQADPEAAARAAQAQAAQAEARADEAARAFDAAYASGNFALAAAQGDVLLAEHPDSAAAGRIKERHADARAKAQSERETRRLSALWAYQSQPVRQGTQLSAGIYSRDPVKTGTASGDRVRLIFRDHPDWGRSAYLVLQDGDFDCYGGCRVEVAVDDATPARMAASRPKTDEAIAMFIEDEFALWRKAAASTRTLTITFPVKAGGTRTAVFETGELDATKLAKWPQGPKSARAPASGDADTARLATAARPEQARAGAWPACAAPLFACTTTRGTAVRVCDAVRTVDYAYGAPGQVPELSLSVPRDAVTTTQWNGIGRHMYYSVSIPSAGATYEVFSNADKFDEHSRQGIHVHVPGRDAATIACRPGTVTDRLEGARLRTAA